MKPNDRLKKIQSVLDSKSLGLHRKDLRWLITRVKSLETREKKLIDALEQIGKVRSETEIGVNILSLVAREALEDET
jgi:hypothetical protein